MEAADADYPAYGFRENKGYPGLKGSQHRTALEQFGPSELHRRSIGPVKEWLMRHSESDGLEGSAGAQHRCRRR